MRSLVVDISSIVFRVAAVQKEKAKKLGDVDPKDIVGLTMHTSLQSIYKWYTKYRPDFVVFAFEGGSNWRKDYTKQNNLSRQYKANRVVDPEMKHLYEVIDSFKELMSNHTSVCCLCVPTMEADDAIAGYCQTNASEDNEIFIISGDKDFIQLLKLPNVTLINPENGEPRNQPGDKAYQEDIDYWLFLKCVRGDVGDNVPSAFPRVRETKIKEAYDDTFKRLNFLNQEWEDEHEVKQRVGDRMVHNEVLMDLTKQPEEQRKLLLEGVETQSKAVGKYNHFQFLKFLKTYELEQVNKNVSGFTDMFTNNQKFLKGELVIDRSETKSRLSEIYDKYEQRVEKQTNTKLLNF
jgi:5'-3' exonuclease